MLHILTFKVLSIFSAKFLVLYRFLHFWRKFQAISGPESGLQISRFPGSIGNHVLPKVVRQALPSSGTGGIECTM